MTIADHGDAVLREIDRVHAAEPPEEKVARVERERRMREGKARRMAWLMKREGLK